MDWYDSIEPGIREVVRLLRDNGFNTECSCAHEQYVQCAYVTDGELMRLDSLLFNAGYRDYYIDVAITREEGHGRAWMQVSLRKQPAPEGGEVYPDDDPAPIDSEDE